MTTTRFQTNRPNEAPLPDPLAYFLTWTTYGTWLSGDQRGWVKRSKGMQLPSLRRKRDSRRRMAASPCVLDSQQRLLVEHTIAEHCRIRKWHLHVVNCRTNHVHVIVTANAHPDVVREQFKAWCTGKLNELQRSRNQTSRTNWWTERGSDRYLNNDGSLEAAILYVKDGQ